MRIIKVLLLLQILVTIKVFVVLEILVVDVFFVIVIACCWNIAIVTTSLNVWRCLFFITDLWSSRSFRIHHTCVPIWGEFPAGMTIIK